MSGPWEVLLRYSSLNLSVVRCGGWPDWGYGLTIVFACRGSLYVWSRSASRRQLIQGRSQGNAAAYDDRDRTGEQRSLLIADKPTTAPTATVWTL
jgi:hypothetical protein